MQIESHYSCRQHLVLFFQCGTQEKHFPPTQIFYNSRHKQLSMQIKMERVGCYQATVSYGDVNLRNGDFNILVLSCKYKVLQTHKL